MNNGNTIKFECVGHPVTGYLKEDNENKVKLIAGKLNNCNLIYYWNIDNDTDFEIGDYAIVENMKSYDLVRIIGVVETTKELVGMITNCKINKNVIQIVDLEG